MRFGVITSNAPEGRTWRERARRAEALCYSTLCVQPDEAVDIPLTLIWTIDQLCDTVEQCRRRYGFTYWIVPDTAMEALAPVVERLRGR